MILKSYLSMYPTYFDMFSQVHRAQRLETFRSTALVADAAHSLSDLISDAVATKDTNE